MILGVLVANKNNPAIGMAAFAVLKLFYKKKGGLEALRQEIKGTKVRTTLSTRQALGQESVI